MYINIFMTYLTNHYKNLCEQYQNKINILQNLLNEDAPASTFSGTGQGQQTFSDEQLRDQMKQNKRSNAFGPAIPDDKQNQAYRDAQAELARRSQANDEEKTLMTGVAKELGMSPEDMLAKSPYAQKRWSKYATPTPSPKPSATPEVTPTPSPKPSATPEVTPTPSSKLSDTPEDTPTPLGALLKYLSSKPSATPEVTPEATPKPTTTPTSNPEPTTTPTSNPEQRTIPSNIRIPGYSLVSNSTSNFDNLYDTQPSGSIAAKPSNGSILDQKPDIAVPEENSKKPTQSSNNFVQDLLQPFKDYADQQSAHTKQGANNFVQDLLQPFKDYTDQQSAQTIQGAQNLLEPVTTYANELNAQEKINNIVKKLGNPRRVKMRRGMKKK